MGGAYLCDRPQVNHCQLLPERWEELCNAEEERCHHCWHGDLCSHTPPAVRYLQQQVEAAHGPVPEVVETVSGVVGMETSAPTVGGEPAVLRRQRQFPNISCPQDVKTSPASGRTRTHRSQTEAAAAASAELMLTLAAGEVKTTPPRQAEDALAAWTLWGQERHRNIKNIQVQD